MSKCPKCAGTVVTAKARPTAPLNRIGAVCGQACGSLSSAIGLFIGRSHGWRKGRAQTAALAVFALLCSSAVGTLAAATVTIEPGDYSGTYKVLKGGDEVVSRTSGPVTEDLAAGSYVLVFAPSVSFTFDVGGNGNVSSGNTDAAEGGGGTLTFRNTTIAVDPGGYIGTYFLNDDKESPRRLSGEQDVVLPLGISDYILGFAPGTNFRFDVDGDGKVSSDNTDAAEGGSGSLTFRNTTIAVDPGGYVGTYFLNDDRAPPRRLSGEQDVVLPLGVSDYILGFAPGTNFRFDIDGDGKVSSDNTDAAEGGAKRLVFHNVTISVDPTDYAGTYFFNEDSQDLHSGETEIVLVTGIQDINLGLRPGVGKRFNIDADGEPDSPVLVEDGAATRTFLLTKKAVLVVEIDIRPGSTKNPVKPGSNGRVPVAILTTQTFDAGSVDTDTVRFGRTGQEACPRKTSTEDVDGDGDNDLLLHFRIPQTGIQCGDTSAVLTGTTKPGQAIEGSDAIKTVGCP